MYGRRMLKGVLESKGIKVSEGRVAIALQRVAPLQYQQRRYDAVDRLNPSPYIALHFGHKLHLDQNEKLRMFGVTHVIAKDGYSGKIVACATMPVKNNLAIYDSIYRYGFYITILKVYVTISPVPRPHPRTGKGSGDTRAISTFTCLSCVHMHAGLIVGRRCTFMLHQPA